MMPETSHGELDRGGPTHGGGRDGGASASLIVVVSGLPRSGTSMLMQMLGAGGIPLLRDDVRGADPDNPRGFFELEAVKRLRTDSAFLSQAVGHAVKIVAPLLMSLPPSHAYRIVFIERSLDEVLASQRRMLERQGVSSGASAEDEARLRGAFERALRATRDWIDREECARARFVSHAEVLSAPTRAAAHIADFLATEILAGRVSGAPDVRPPPPGLEAWAARFAADREAIVRAMASVVDPSLYRATAGAVSREGATADPETGV